MEGVRKQAIGALMLSMLVVAGASAPAAVAKDNPKKAIWGPVVLKGKSAFPTYRELGVSIFSIALDWGAVAANKPTNAKDPNDPAYKWPDTVDDAVIEAPANGMQVNLEVTKAPNWSTGCRSRTPQCAPRKASDYADFVTAAARRYPTVRLWMIWGEPNRQRNFFAFNSAPATANSLNANQAQGPRRYAELVDKAWVALKAESADNKVIGGNTEPAGDIFPGLWIKYMKLKDKSGKYTVPPRMDMYGHNPFPMSGRIPALNSKPSAGPSRSNFMDFSDLGRMHTLVDKEIAKPLAASDESRPTTMKLFLSEFCIPTSLDGEGEFSYAVDLKPNPKTPNDKANQVDWINSAFSVVNSNDWIHSLGWIHFQDIKAKYRRDPRGTRAGLLDFSGNPKPGYYAFKNG